MACFGGASIPVRAIIAASLTLGLLGLAFYTNRQEVITSVCTLAGMAIGFYFNRPKEGQ